MSQTANLHIASNIALPSPRSMVAEIAPTEAQTAFIAESRREIRDIIFGNDSRFLVVLGPCSIHEPEAGLEYARKLAALAQELKDRLCIVMRVYFEKPRTTVGWKGLIMDPDLDGTCNIPNGLRLARKILRDVLDLGLPTATELLDPITPQYIADLISWSAIGARTTESQTHRQMASGLSMPLGFKNGTFGHITPAINAIKAAMQPQTFLGVNEDGVASAVTTSGNPDGHIILRGGENETEARDHDRRQPRQLRQRPPPHAGCLPRDRAPACRRAESHHRRDVGEQSRWRQPEIPATARSTRARPVHHRCVH